MSIPTSAQPNAGRLVLDVPGYPLLLELNEGQMYSVKRTYKNRTVERTIKLVSIRHFTESNLWFSGSLPSWNYSKAEVMIEVSGTPVTLLHRAYQMPVTAGGLRLYVETTKEWAQNAELADMKDVERDVRLSVCLEEEPWGPTDIEFPINDYRWRSGAYNNTWSSLVPYNKLYYHRGEDYGAIPDLLPVVSPVNGTIISTPLPEGDGKSNGIRIRNDAGFVFRISHMNIETINKDNVEGKEITAGTLLGKTGMTWDGRKSQDADPHCHIDMSYDNTHVASFPYLMEAYLRKYGDPVVAVAGGYQFTTAGQKITLDAGRSIAGERIASYTWKLNDGEVIQSAVAEVKYENPGLYTEELIVTTESGDEDRDFIQVRVYEPNEKIRDLAYGWAYFNPVRNLKAAQPTLFWNRIMNAGEIVIDFGDGTRKQIIGRELNHTFSKPGIYTVTLSGTDKQKRPVSVKLEVPVGQ
jgi:murein DD-endopeptidase MepM/ murein hydrolase activator NlpD